MISLAYVYGKQRSHDCHFLTCWHRVSAVEQEISIISRSKVTKLLMALAIAKQMLMYRPESLEEQNC